LAVACRGGESNRGEGEGRPFKVKGEYPGGGGKILIGNKMTTYHKGGVHLFSPTELL